MPIGAYLSVVALYTRVWKNRAIQTTGGLSICSQIKCRGGNREGEEEEERERGVSREGEEEEERERELPAAWCERSERGHRTWPGSRSPCL